MSYALKPYRIPGTRKIIRLQGYEHFCFTEMVRRDGIPSSDILHERKHMPKIMYLDSYMKLRRYIPDFYLPRHNKIVEVKSEYTWKIDKANNERKVLACVEAGFAFEVRVYDKRGFRVWSQEALHKKHKLQNRIGRRRWWQWQGG